MGWQSRSSSLFRGCKCQTTGQEEALELARTHEAMKGELDGKRVVKEIYVPGRLVNLVVAK
jgi:leucyl-tRNA synthetase